MAYVLLESAMLLTLTIAGAACGSVAGMGFGVAAVVREYYRGKSTLLRAQRGEAEPRAERPALPRLFRK